MKMISRAILVILSLLLCADLFVASAKYPKNAQPARSASTALVDANETSKEALDTKVLDDDPIALKKKRKGKKDKVMKEVDSSVRNESKAENDDETMKAAVLSVVPAALEKDGYALYDDEEEYDWQEEEYGFEVPPIDKNEGEDDNGDSERNASSTPLVKQPGRKGNSTSFLLGYQSGKLAIRLPLLLAKLAMKHRGTTMTLTLILLIFRRDIVRFVLNRSPMDILKLVLCVRLLIQVAPLLLRKSSRGSDGAGGSTSEVDSTEEEGRGRSSSSLLTALLLLMGRGRTNPLLLTLWLSKLLSPMSGNTAYVPSIEQHYTFERVNERYQIDGMALEKAMGSARTTGDNNLWKSVLSNENRSPKVEIAAMKPHAQPKNDTVIIMDLTQLGSQKMEILRDKVSFLLSEYRSRALTLAASRAEATRLALANSSAVTDSLKEANQRDQHQTCAHAVHKPTDMEVVVILESPGGGASEFALASQQLLRLRREPGVAVTVVVDKVAASGGYMMACTSSPGRLFAAPFSLIGSIGVVGQTLNVQDLLDSWGVRSLVFRGGRNKAPIGMTGPVTREGMATVQDMVDDTHRAFRRHVAEARPVIADRIVELATGQVWLGYDALQEGLIDRLITSDEYIGERLAEGARILKMVELKRSKNPFLKPSLSSSNGAFSSSSDAMESLFRRVLMGVVHRTGILSMLQRLAADLPAPGSGADCSVPMSLASKASASTVGSYATNSFT